MRRNILFAGSAIALSMASTPATAESVTVTGNPERSATVSIADFNLDSPAGIARLKSRIEAVAADLCLTNAVEPVGMRMARVKCYRTAVSSGHRQINRMLAAKAVKSNKT